MTDELVEMKWRPASTDPVALLKLEDARKRRRVVLVEDIFAPEVDDARIDLVFAVMCSLAWHVFAYQTRHKGRRRMWMARVRREGKPAVRRCWRAWPLNNVVDAAARRMGL